MPLSAIILKPLKGDMNNFNYLTVAHVRRWDTVYYILQQVNSQSLKLTC